MLSSFVCYFLLFLVLLSSLVSSQNTCPSTASPLCTSCFSNSLASTCSSCSSGYYLAQTSCLPCSLLDNDETNYYCTACNPTSCTACGIGNITINGVCQPCYNAPNFGAYCTACNSTNCLSCSFGYYVQNGTCNECQAAIPNCENCFLSDPGSTTPTCTSCDTDYLLYNNNCLSCSQGDQSAGIVGVPNCATCTITGSTLTCLNCGIQSGSQTLSQQECYTHSQVYNCLITSDDTSKCYSCNQGYYLDAGTGQCISCPMAFPHCNICNPEVCTQCGYESYFVNGMCEGFSHTGYPPCLTQDENRGCASCLAGSYLQYPNCLPCDPICTACNGSATNCFPCPTGQYQINGQCIYCNSVEMNCSECTYDPATGMTCLQCDSGYHLTPQNTCITGSLPDSNCLIGNETFCAACQPGYTNLGICLPCFENCLTCDGPLSCQVCADGYTKPVNSSWCLKISSNYLTSCNGTVLKAIDSSSGEKSILGGIAVFLSCFLVN